MNVFVSFPSQTPPRTPPVTLQAIPSGGFAVYDSVTAGAGAPLTSTLNSKTAQQTVYLVGFTITSGPPSIATPITIVVTVSDGTWTLSFQFVETVSAGGWMQKELFNPIVASAPNTPIVVSVPGVANGGVVAIESHGYSL